MTHRTNRSCRHRCNSIEFQVLEYRNGSPLGSSHWQPPAKLGSATAYPPLQLLREDLTGSLVVSLFSPNKTWQPLPVVVGRFRIVFGLIRVVERKQLVVPWSAAVATDTLPERTDR